MDKIVVGNVLAIEGTKVNILMRENTNLINYHYNGTDYNGVGINQFVGIIRGPYTIVGLVEKEFLKDKFNDPLKMKYNLSRFERVIEVSIKGYFTKNDSFNFGVKLPTVYSEVVLLGEKEVNSIISKSIVENPNNPSLNFIKLGSTIFESNKVIIPVSKLFNTHLGIFGNTGSGKSNTLAKIYGELFEKVDFLGKSEFIFLDFNGEYTSEHSMKMNNKIIVNLNTSNDKGDKLEISNDYFWDVEVLSVLFSATEKTQQPFLKSVVNSYKYYSRTFNNNQTEMIKTLLQSTFVNCFNNNQHKESINLFFEIINTLNLHELLKRNGLSFSFFDWRSTSYYFIGSILSGKDKYLGPDSVNLFNHFNNTISNLNFDNTLSEVIILRCLIYSTLIYNLSVNSVNYEHISPLISRIYSVEDLIFKTVKIVDSISSYDVKVISFRLCNQQCKKIIPLLVAKQLYDHHIKENSNQLEIRKTKHLIIDEAHNILSNQTSREAESFKDYRLDVFEQIIKEGRKFGFYVTISSQRPYDISPTIISQLHNYFIHRLVNENDIRMLNNTIGSLDKISRDLIPTLAPGQCVITGTTFDMPLLIQVDKLEKENAPASENADLDVLWGLKEESGITNE